MRAALEPPAISTPFGGYVVREQQPQFIGRGRRCRGGQSHRLPVDDLFKDIPHGPAIAESKRRLSWADHRNREFALCDDAG